MSNTAPPFDGATYDHRTDHKRLTVQLDRVRDLMVDAKWRTLSEISVELGGASEASISARLRDLRKEKFGSFTVDRRQRGAAERGLYEYQVLRPTPKVNAAGQYGLPLGRK